MPHPCVSRKLREARSLVRTGEEQVCIEEVAAELASVTLDDRFLDLLTTERS
jgi:hypothetical protein